jgi:lipoprotein-releasing system permease protein
MNIPFEFHIAVRYLVAKRKQAFISVISLVSALGVTVGVMALVIALALQTGLQQELRDRILGSNPHIFVWKRSGIVDYRAESESLRRFPHVVGAAPAILGKALVTASNDSSTEAFINVKGIDPELEPAVTALGAAMRTGSLASLSTASEGPAAVLLGTDLAARLGVGVGDTISALTPGGTLTPSGMRYLPRTLTVAGTFALGLYEIDSETGFVALDTARRLFAKQEVDAIQLRLDDVILAPRVSEDLGQALGADYIAQDWADVNRSLFSALKLEKMAISLTIGLIVMVAALNIVASLVLLVMEKHRDIGILKTMGASARSVTLIFMIQGLLVGVAGTSVGAAVGYVVSQVADRYRLVRLPSDVYQITHVPFIVVPLELTLVIVAAILVCFLATLYPSRQAARLDPAQALRYE